MYGNGTASIHPPLTNISLNQGGSVPLNRSKISEMRWTMARGRVDSPPEGVLELVRNGLFLNLDIGWDGGTGKRTEGVRP